MPDIRCMPVSCMPDIRCMPGVGAWPGLGSCPGVGAWPVVGALTGVGSCSDTDCGVGSGGHRLYCLQRFVAMDMGECVVFVGWGYSP